MKMLSQDLDAQLILMKHIFAREYGWTPTEVENLDSVEADLLLFTIGVEKRAQEAESKKCLTDLR